MLSILRPREDQIARFLEIQSGLDFSYEEVGATRGGSPQGYHVNGLRMQIGTGQADFEAARRALCRWQQFDTGWVQISPPDAPITPGTSVAILANVYGLWSLNACRIIYVVDQEELPVTQFGFAYGTLPDHAEHGEERFLVEWDRRDDSVWYEVFAFFRPKHWYVRAGWPMVFPLVNRFRRDSVEAMRRAIRTAPQAGGGIERRDMPW